MAIPKGSTGHPPSKRQKTDLTNLAGPPDTQWAWQATSELPSNAFRGILALSAELVDEILSHLQCITDHTSLNDSESNAPLLGSEYLERINILRALSQTCAAYRTRFLPMSWWALEVCCQGRVNQAWYMYIGKALQRKCTGLANHPELAQYVQVVRVIVTRYREETVLPAFVSCLTLLSNLHTLHLVHVNSQMTTALRNAFEGTSLPSMRSIMLPGHAHEILRSCPNVTYVKCICNTGTKLTTVIRKSCPNVEVIEGFYPDLSLMKRIVKAIPNLRTIRFQPDVDSKTVKALASSKFIQKLEFETVTQIGEEFRPSLQQCILEAKSILKVKAGKKVIRVWHRQPNFYMYNTYTDVDLD